MSEADPVLRFEPEALYAAHCRRDARFDGRFFTGVTTTRVFCRPICPAPTPRADHCRYFRSAAAAQADGFRPCLRCRPESAPGTAAWRGSEASVSRALRLIEQGALDGEGTVEALASRLGIGDRHLRRLFDVHLGTTPSDVARLRRVLFAKQLLDETDLPMVEIAVCAGFGSQRRFNACLREVYDRSPSALRAARKSRARGAAAGAVVELSLPYRAPFDWAALLAYFARRAIAGVEAVDPVRGRYARTIRTSMGPGSIRVRDEPAKSRLRVEVRLGSTTGLLALHGRLRTLFDLDADASAIDAIVARAACLRADVRARPGLRVPGAFDGFETAVRGILGQQISVGGASTLAGRIATRFGDEVPTELRIDDTVATLFPTPARLVDAELETLGVIRARADAIRGLARAVAADPTLLEPGPGLEPDLLRWQALPGIGPWTAQIVAMRVLREPDALPASDLGLRKAITPEGLAPRTAAEVEALLEPCRPYRAYAAMRLWSLERAKAVERENEVGPKRASTLTRGPKTTRTPTNKRAPKAKRASGAAAS